MSAYTIWSILLELSEYNSAIKINDKSTDILHVKYREHGHNRCSWKAFVRQYLAVLVCGC